MCPPKMWQEVKHKDSMLSYLLQNAIAKKNVKPAKLLLRNGADVDDKNKIFSKVNTAIAFVRDLEYNYLTYRI